MKNNMRNNTVVIYHKDCNDGFGAAWAHWYWNTNKETTEYIPMQYGEEIPISINEKSTVYFLDFCPNEDNLVSLLLKVEHVYIVDHHKTALYALDLVEHFHNLTSIINVNYSGAILSWNVFRKGNKEAPYFLQLIQDRDLWLFTFKDTKPFHQALLTITKEFEVWSDLVIESNVQELVAKGISILQYQHTILYSLLKDISIGSIQQEPVVFSNCPPILSSDMANVIFTEYSKAQVACLFYVTDNYVKYSLRNNTKKEKGEWIDVSKIAKEYGGGGHASAAGFSLHITDSHLAGKRL
jgi:oligoribonuclease NrnB/cAMP/cGMP phosphodiesterase (DHH superfamily)